MRGGEHQLRQEKVVEQDQGVQIDQLMIPATRNVVEEEEENVNNMSGMMGELSSQAGDLWDGWCQGEGGALSLMG